MIEPIGRLTLVAGVAAVLTPGLTGRTANADPVVDIVENDGQPDIRPDPTELLWKCRVFNNSDTEPPDNPWNEYLWEVRFYDLFSTQLPSVVHSPPLWEAPVTPGGGQDLWDVVITGPLELFPIRPGLNADFWIVTYRPETLPAVLVGTCYGQGHFPSGWAPPDPGDHFLGPVGLESLCVGDLDGDADTDQSDLGILLADWGCTELY